MGCPNEKLTSLRTNTYNLSDLERTTMGKLSNEELYEKI